MYSKEYQRQILGVHFCTHFLCSLLECDFYVIGIKIPAFKLIHSDLFSLETNAYILITITWKQHKEGHFYQICRCKFLFFDG